MTRIEYVAPLFGAIGHTVAGVKVEFVAFMATDSMGLHCLCLAEDGSFVSCALDQLKLGRVEAPTPQTRETKTMSEVEKIDLADNMG